MKRLLFTLATLIAACSSALALPASVHLEQNGIGAHDWSVTPDGTAFVLKTSPAAAGLHYRSGGDVVQSLAPFEPPASPAASPTYQRVMLNPDGRYLLNFKGDRVAVRDAASTATVWQGTLPNYPRPYGSQAAYFRAADQRLQLLSGNTLLTFVLASEGATTSKIRADVAFVQVDRRVAGNFVQTGAFSADGGRLFLGTMDGEVLQVDVTGEAPELRRRIKAFQPYRAPGFSDDADGYVSRLHCVEDCRRLVLGSYRSRQAAVVDVEAGQVRGRLTDAARVHVVGIGDDWFVVSRGEGKEASTGLTDADLSSPIPIPELGAAWLAFGFNGGVATSTSERGRSDFTTNVTFTDVKSMIPELSRRRLQEAEAVARQQVAELKRVRLISERRPEYLRRLKSGDDSHCGLIVERKGDIALIETQIGQKWLKVNQLHEPGSRNCVFVNGVLQQ